MIKEAAGEDTALAEAINDLLLPLVKGYGSERSWVLLGTESLQTFGGSGFLQDYPIEQYVRDAKIDTLYEGTTAIQGQDLFFRKIVKDKGQALGYLSNEIQQFVAERGRQRSSQGRARAARQGPRGRAGHPRRGVPGPDVGQSGRRERRHHEHLQGGTEHDPPGLRARRHRRGVAAAARRRGGAGEAGRRRVGRRQGVLRGQGRCGVRSSPATSCRCWLASGPSPRTSTARSWISTRPASELTDPRSAQAPAPTRCGGFLHARPILERVGGE